MIVVLRYISRFGVPDDADSATLILPRAYFWYPWRKLIRGYADTERHFQAAALGGEYSMPAAFHFYFLSQASGHFLFISA